MKLTLALVALALQLGAPESSAPTADPQHFRYQRNLALATSSAGQACTLLDAPVFAHAASAGASDLRLFATTASGSLQEQPFNLSESEAQPADVETAAIRNLGMRNNDIVFDLVMPQRAYTEVDLNLDAQNFIALATVTAPSRQGPATTLGTFTLFDLTRQHLGRSTALALQESTFPLLHITLHLTGLDGHPLAAVTPSIVRAAQVPPSREAQTLYTTVAATQSVASKGRQTVAIVHVPAHVPIERIAFTLDPAFRKNFFREVAISATPDQPTSTAEQPSMAETVAGELSRVHVATNATAPAINTQQLTVDAALGASLDTGSTVTVAIANGDDPPLPIHTIELQMRRRTLCFDAAPETTYALLYGDATLHPPVYDYARLFQPSSSPILATLGPEQLNPRFIGRADERPYTERHPEFLWIGLIFIVAVLGATAVQTIKRQGRE